jgi:hypothetical protein
MELGQGQWIVFTALLGLCALLAFFTLALGLQDGLLAGQETPPELAERPGWVLGLANGGMIVVAYGLSGAFGLWLGGKAGLPGVFRPGAGWRAWVWTPMALGLIVGALMVAGDRALAALGRWEGLPHPGFPLSLFASGSAGIGEEIVFRGFMMSLWAFLLHLLSRRSGHTTAAVWVANGIAALAFIAGHAPVAMVTFAVRSPLALPPAALADLALLNGLVALVAGQQYARSGLVAAMGVHFWADVVWHVIWPLVG